MKQSVFFRNYYPNYKTIIPYGYYHHGFGETLGLITLEDILEE